MRVGGALYFLHGDHLGSATLTTGASGNWVGEARYTPYGEMRRDYPRGVIPTDRLYTGQRQETFGLYDYRARYYHPALGRFISADPLVPEPGNPQALNRYAYVRNNPLRYMDPSGHRLCGPYCDASEMSGDWPPPPDHHDLTDWLVREMVANATGPEVQLIRQLNVPPPVSLDPEHSAELHLGGRIAAALLWRSLVKDSARWDFKDRIEQELQRSIMLGGEWFEFSVPGNIHYAYVGRAAGFTLQELHLGASWAEIRDPDHDGQPSQIRIPILGRFYFNPAHKPTGYDDPYDYAAIEFGSALYDRYGPDVTVAEFEALLVEYAPDLLHMPAPPPGYQNPAWPYPLGHFDGGR